MPMLGLRDGCRLHVETIGEGPAVVLIPGLGGMARFWSSIIPALARRYRVVSFDHRGAGRSERPDQAYSIDLLAADVVDMLDRLDLERAHVVGHSTGGAIGQVLAVDYPDRVDRLVLSASWDRPTSHFLALFEARLQILETLGPEAYARLTQLIGFPPDWLDENAHIIAQAAGMARSELTPLPVAVARLRMLFDFDRSADLRRIRHPTLVIGARDDMIVAYGRSVSLAEAIPNAVLLPRDGGHFFPRVDPERFIRDLSFLDGNHR